ncbi:helix-turn-helix domain-containing protein [Brochothrix thermosphacta]|uniref:helix-turn-helix domain-containing protein n=1 Tax=Brochothrix thermosphacta TaxID=2756 RepID=UPI00159EFDDF
MSNRSTLTSFYYKKTTNIRVSTLLKICDYLEIELLELIGFMPLKKSKEKKL